MTILTMARYEWFEEWAGTRSKHRGPDYQRYKLAIAQRLLERALQRFPHLRDKVTRVPVVSLARRVPGRVGVWWGWGAPSMLECPTGVGAQWGWGVPPGWDAPRERGTSQDGMSHRAGVPSGGCRVDMECRGGTGCPGGMGCPVGQGAL